MAAILVHVCAYVLCFTGVYSHRGRLEPDIPQEVKDAAPSIEELDDWAHGQWEVSCDTHTHTRARAHTGTQVQGRGYAGSMTYVCCICDLRTAGTKTRSHNCVCLCVCMCTGTSDVPVR